MKAKEYAEQYVVARTEEARDKVLINFIVETQEVVKKRNAKTRQGVINLFNELDNKWRTMCILISKRCATYPNPANFEEYVRASAPELHKFWKSQKQ